jgi:hypothetical protein
VTAPEDADLDQWITDARNAGGPVIFTGVLLLVAVAGVPVLVAMALMVLAMFTVQFHFAGKLISPPESDWPHG